MIDPNHITNYQLSNKQLQQQIIFWLLVAGKTANTISKRMKPIFQDLEKVWKKEHGAPPPGTLLPFDLISELHKGRRNTNWLARLLKRNGVGCHSVKAKGLVQLANKKPDLRTCNLKELEEIKGIGKKTSRCFLLHTRPNAQCSGLDTHILSCLNELGYDVPKSSPGSEKKYREVEQIFLDLARKANKTPAKLDLIIWRVYSSHKHLKPLLMRILHETNARA